MFTASKVRPHGWSFAVGTTSVAHMVTWQSMCGVHILTAGKVFPCCHGNPIWAAAVGGAITWHISGVEVTAGIVWSLSGLLARAWTATKLGCRTASDDHLVILFIILASDAVWPGCYRDSVLAASVLRTRTSTYNDLDLTALLVRAAGRGFSIWAASVLRVLAWVTLCARIWYTHAASRIVRSGGGTFVVRTTAKLRALTTTQGHIITSLLIRSGGGASIVTATIERVFTHCTWWLVVGTPLTGPAWQTVIHVALQWLVIKLLT